MPIFPAENMGSRLAENLRSQLKSSDWVNRLFLPEIQSGSFGSNGVQQEERPQSVSASVSSQASSLVVPKKQSATPRSQTAIVDILHKNERTNISPPLFLNEKTKLLENSRKSPISLSIQRISLYIKHASINQ
jgi:hypothetical protein